MKKGRFITLEGGEGAGKSTLQRSLESALSKKGMSVLVTREPGGCQLAEEVRNWLLHGKESPGQRAELLLFLAARAEHVAKVIRPALEQGKWVICDRFMDSTLAYQGYARSLGIEQVYSLCLWAQENLEPDLTFLLDLSPQEGLQRSSKVGEADRMESEGLAFHHRVREGFMQLQERFAKRMHVLNAGQPAEQVLADALQILGL